MTRKRKRLYLVLGGLGTLAVVSGLVLSAMSDNLVFFYSPSELRVEGRAGRAARAHRRPRRERQRHARGGRATIEFRVTDGKEDVPVDL